MAVPCNFEVIARKGKAGRKRADELAALPPTAGWQTLSCGNGAKGPRLYDWALIDTTGPAHQILVRRSLTPNDKGELGWRSSTATPRGGHHWPTWSPPGPGGTSRSASRPPRTGSAWTTTRSASGTPGTASDKADQAIARGIDALVKAERDDVGTAGVLVPVA
jgi:hypothetical protein